MEMKKPEPDFLAACLDVTILNHPEEIPEELEKLRFGNPMVNAVGLIELSNVLCRQDYEGLQAEEVLASFVLLASSAPELLKDETFKTVVAERIQKYAALLNDHNHEAAALANAMIAYLSGEHVPYPATLAQEILHIAAPETPQIKSAKKPIKHLVKEAFSVNVTEKRIKKFPAILGTDVDEIIQHTKHWVSQPPQAETEFVYNDIIPLANILVRIMRDDLKPEPLNGRCAAHKNKVIEAYACIFTQLAKYKQESWAHIQFEYKTRNGALLKDIAQTERSTVGMVVATMEAMGVEERIAYIEKMLPRIQELRETKAGLHGDSRNESHGPSPGFDEKKGSPLANACDEFVQQYKKWATTPEANGKTNNFQSWPQSLQAALKKMKQRAPNNDMLRGALNVAMRSHKLSEMAARILGNAVDRTLSVRGVGS